MVGPVGGTLNAYTLISVDNAQPLSYDVAMKFIAALKSAREQVTNTFRRRRDEAKQWPVRCQIVVVHVVATCLTHAVDAAARLHIEATRLSEATRKDQQAKWRKRIHDYLRSVRVEELKLMRPSDTYRVGITKQEGVKIARVEGPSGYDASHVRNRFYENAEVQSDQIAQVAKQLGLSVDAIAANVGKTRVN